MNGTFAAALAAFFVAALSFAQDGFPGLAFYHTWQYALALAVALVVCVQQALRTRRYRLAMLGVVVIGASALYAGLTGPDTATLTRGPGQVVHTGGGAVVRFPIAGANDVRAGDSRLDVLGRGTLPPGGRSYAGSLVLVSQMRPAAYVEAYDLDGRHLTVTQPQGSTFLSRVLLFPGRAALSGRTYPVDVFALPALARTVETFYFSPADVAAVRRAGLPRDEPGLLVALLDNNRKLVPNGIGFLPQGTPATVGDVRLTASIGRYPVLMVASAPWPPLLIGGALITLLGVTVRRRRERAGLSANRAA